MTDTLNRKSSETASLPLDAWHRAQDARMVEFAGYSMPIQYEGIMAEHLWTRAHAGLFDVSHMGQLVLTGKNIAAALEKLVPGEIVALKPGRIRYTLLLAPDGGIVDDLMVTNISTDNRESYYLVVNGATKHGDIDYLRANLSETVELEHLENQALVALQGPEAQAALERLMPGAANDLYFMQGTSREWEGVEIGISRSGYTGEDGFELSVPASHVERLAEALVAMEEVQPVGLGARDSLRLEAGLPLYGHDLTPLTTPVAADLGFAIGKRRREEGGFAGADRVLAELRKGPQMRRVGLELEGRQPVREGTEVVDDAGNAIGNVTSGGFAPSLGHPIAMAYVPDSLAEPGTPLALRQRGRTLAGKAAAMPFVPHRYRRKPKR